MNYLSSMPTCHGVDKHLCTLKKCLLNFEASFLQLQSQIQLTYVPPSWHVARAGWSKRQLETLTCNGHGLDTPLWTFYQVRYLGFLLSRLDMSQKN